MPIVRQLVPTSFCARVFPRQCSSLERLRRFRHCPQPGLPTHPSSGTTSHSPINRPRASHTSQTHTTYSRQAKPLPVCIYTPPVHISQGPASRGTHTAAGLIPQAPAGRHTYTAASRPHQTSAFSMRANYPAPPTLEGYQDRVVGALIGCMCGDTLGAAAEGWTPSEIVRRFGGGLVDIQTTGPRGGKYTDDTVMTIALAKSLVDMRRCDEVDAARAYVQMFDPHRGYGGGAIKIMFALQAGADARTIGGKFLPGGSFGNGGAMRIAPAGLAYRNAPLPVLHSAVEAALLCTHIHPLGIDGAYIQALAVAWLSKTSPSTSNPAALLSYLLPLARTTEMASILQFLIDSLPAIQQLPQHQARVSCWGTLLSSEAWLTELEISDRAALQSKFQIKATDAMGATLTALLTHWNYPEDCVIAAVHYGGDVDTIAAMAGALTGALHGVGWVPERWWGQLENRVDGRDDLVELGRRLSELDVRV